MKVLNNNRYLKFDNLLRTNLRHDFHKVLITFYIHNGRKLNYILIYNKLNVFWLNLVTKT